MGNMIANSIRKGTSDMVKRPGLVALLYGVNLVIGLIVVFPLYSALDAATSISGYSPELAEQFSLTLWTDVIESILPALRGFLAQLLWIIPLVLVWKAVSSVGIITTLSTNGLRSFWSGIGEYGGRAIILSIGFLIPVLLLLVGLVLISAAALGAFPGEVAGFWVNVIFLPLAFIFGLSVLDWMHDFARMELVLGNEGVVAAFLAGLLWPIRHFSSVWIYASWFIVSAIVLLVTTLIDVQAGGLWGVFILQQVLLLTRAGITVGWFGSEVSFYDSVAYAELPTIAVDSSEAFTESV